MITIEEASKALYQELKYNINFLACREEAGAIVCLVEKLGIAPHEYMGFQVSEELPV